jgi:hypothetical protein
MISRVMRWQMRSFGTDVTAAFSQKRNGNETDEKVKSLKAEFKG